MRGLPFPNGEHYVPGSLFKTNLLVNGGLIELDLETVQHFKMLHNSPLSTPHGLWLWALQSTFQTSRVDRSSIFFLSVSFREPDIKVYTGNGECSKILPGKHGFVWSTKFDCRRRKLVDSLLHQCKCHNTSKQQEAPLFSYATI